MKTQKALLSLVITLALCSSVNAKENIGTHHKPVTVDRVLTNGCSQDLGAAYLNLNNVRARIMDEGDMWWDPGAGLPRYYVPAAGPACSEFSGALWIGGVDAGGQLKIAAMTYRQNGEDYWAGPLDTATVSITPARCAYYDKIYTINRAEVQNYVTAFKKGPPPTIPVDMQAWPGNGDPSYGEAKFLAPFVDLNQDGIYEPQDGEYPAYDLNGTNTTCQNELFGDQTLWWVYNDEGNTHTETGGIAIGIEIREQAFEFQTNDAINNCTFYQYTVINRSSYQINNTYFGAWNDFDLGNGGDDYTGCDVGRSMGYGYNGEATDPDGSGNFAGEIGYHNDPPAIGETFFEGPKADAADTSNHCISHNGLLGMVRFVYYNNDFTVTGNPQNASWYYNYLKGEWGDGTAMTYGGNGYGGSTPTNYMFPWTPTTTGSVNTDPKGCGTNGVVQSTPWNEVVSHDPFGDRRFIESAGPFTLKPGAVNYVTTGEVWDQPSQGGLGNLVPIPMIQADDDLAQALFNNCFKVLNGPDAPDLTITELNQELIITLSNSITSNNYKESYNQVSPTIVDSKDNTYKFKGYEIFQVLDSSVTASELLNNLSNARLLVECDVKNGVSGWINNYAYNATYGVTTATPEVDAQDNGIVHSFDVKTDLFQEDNITNLVNDRPYYYMAIAYAYNNYKTYNPADTGTDKGQQQPYLQGRRNIRVYSAVPHIPQAQSYGTVQNSNYGAGPQITRVEGHGNGNNVLELTPGSISYILANDTMAHPTYNAGQGPISVKVVDPLNVISANFIIKIYKDTASSKTVDSLSAWKMYIPGVGDTVYSDVRIGQINEQIIPQWGLSVTINQVQNPSALVNGLMDSSCTMTFADPSKPWLSGINSAGPGVSYLFWIRSGSNVAATGTAAPPYGTAFNSLPGSLHGFTVTSTITKTVEKKRWVGDTNIGNTKYTVGNDTILVSNDSVYVLYDSSYTATISTTSSATEFYDPYQYYNKAIGGTWAPFDLASYGDSKLYVDNGPGWPGIDDSISNISNVDIVFTSNMQNWTRCIVYEEQDEPSLAQGGATKLNIRKSASIDQYGNFATIGSGASSNPSAANYISDQGMGWFPGYTINLETGERLNMAYGEDSWLNADNGRDMKWNPDSILVKQNTSSIGAAQLFGITSIFGGKHYIYVFAHTFNGNAKYSIPPYDKDSTIYQYLTKGSPASIYKKEVLQTIMWVGLPLLARGHNLLETDVTVRLRVAKPYDTGYGAPIRGADWRNNTPDNNNYPMYAFNTGGLEVETNNADAASNALNLINVVPNPYYAYSGYESNRLDTRVRFTNLPPVCTISIFTLSGTLINVINKNSPLTYTDWTLENQYGVPIASGMYIINVNVPGVGQKTLKWFGVLRPVDLNSY